MSTVVARNVASTPKRTASETWSIIAAMLAPDPNGAARKELEKAGGVAASCISSEATKDDCIVVAGGGPRVRVYCIFGDDAVTGDGVNEDALVKSPTEGDGWWMSIPCPPEDVEWSNRNLGQLSTRIRVRAVGEDVEEEGSSSRQSPGQRTGAAINLEEFFKP